MVSYDRLAVLLFLGAAHIPAADTTPASYIIQTVAGSDDSADGGSALSTALGQPEGIAVDGSGNVYFADAAVHHVRKIAAGWVDPDRRWHGCGRFFGRWRTGQCRAAESAIRLGVRYIR